MSVSEMRRLVVEGAKIAREIQEQMAREFPDDPAFDPSPLASLRVVSDGAVQTIDLDETNLDTFLAQDGPRPFWMERAGRSWVDGNEAPVFWIEVRTGCEAEAARYLQTLAPRTEEQGE